ncbi:MAG TPA: MoxR family ATPase [Phycisphaerae bacterium]|nr:MoxR family ATPase [Phycisphaerae bacterium]
MGEPDTPNAADNAEVDLSAVLGRIQQARQAIVGELHKVIVGEDEPIDQVLAALLAGGHCMIQGPPGTAKTILIACLARVMDLEFKRIQFTPDLMPSDISGTEILEEDTSSGHRFIKFVQGPVFTNILMADEINRTPPKTQAALLEVMQEKQVTIGGKTNPLPRPHYVLATQITLEQEGTYPLPEAQQDRFMISVAMDYLTEDEEVDVIRQSTSIGQAELQKVIGADDLMEFTRAVRLVKLPEVLGRYIVDLVAASRPTVPGHPPFVAEYVAWGAGLRASQNIAFIAKATAAMRGRDTVTAEDIRKAIVPVLRHRIGLSFRAEVDRVTVEEIIRRLVEAVPEPAAA